MAKGDTFFLRTTLTSSTTSYVSDNIDISAYTSPAQGRVLVIDRSFITFSSDGQGPIVPADIVGTATNQSRSLGAQACTEKQTELVELKDNSLFARCNLYATAQTTEKSAGSFAGPVITQLSIQDALNPVAFTAGFICPTDAIHCGIDTSGTWPGELDVGFMFEVHTEKLSLQRIQELLVSLTAN